MTLKTPIDGSLCLWNKDFSVFLIPTCQWASQLEFSVAISELKCLRQRMLMDIVEQTKVSKFCSPNLISETTEIAVSSLLLWAGLQSPEGPPKALELLSSCNLVEASPVAHANFNLEYIRARRASCWDCQVRHESYSVLHHLFHHKAPIYVCWWGFEKKSQALMHFEMKVFAIARLDWARLILSKIQTSSDAQNLRTCKAI